MILIIDGALAIHCGQRSSIMVNSDDICKPLVIIRFCGCMWKLESKLDGILLIISKNVIKIKSNGSSINLTLSMNWNNKLDPKVTFLQENCLFHFTETRTTNLTVGYWPRKSSTSTWPENYLEICKQLSFSSVDNWQIDKKTLLWISEFGTVT